MPLYQDPEKLQLALDRVSQWEEKASGRFPLERDAFVFTDTATQLGTMKVYRDEVTPVYLVAWDSTFFSSDPEQNIDADYILVFKHKPSSYWGYYEYICAGYSSYTFEPEEECRVYRTSDWDTFFNLGLTDKTRAEFDYVTMEREVLNYKPEAENG